MAEREKRRATTFVTSRGAIINVAAPSVYIAPGVTPVDVTSPEEMREELDIHSVFTWEKFLREGVDAHFNARKVVPPTNIEMLVNASEHWTQDSDITLTLGKLRCPADLSSVCVYSKRAFNYGLLSVSAKLPILNVNQIKWIGFENGRQGLNGIVGFQQYLTKFTAVIQPSVVQWRASADLTPILPANYQTAYHVYEVEITRPMAVFYVDGIPVAYGLLTPGGRYINAFVAPFAPPPYAIFFADSTIARSFTTLLECTGAGAQLDLDVSPGAFRPADGDPLPPRAIVLYNTGTTTLWAGMAVLNTITVTSHPFPLYGYAGKTVDFQATVAGTLFIDVLTQSGNWRVYPPNAGTPITAGVLENFPISGDEVVGRLRFTPAADGTISDAEVHLR